MNLFYNTNFPNNNNKLKLTDNILLLGSCFSNNIGHILKDRKFKTMINPCGTLFDTKSILYFIDTIVKDDIITLKDIELHEEIYFNWHYHSDFSATNPKDVVLKINETNKNALEFIKTSDFIIITIGSSFSYFHKKNMIYVANCHKIPQKEFDKKLITSEETIEDLKNIIKKVRTINRKCKFIFTISPVRHLKDGVVQNNWSKALLINAVHSLISFYKEDIYYFPAYEIVIDILRDYRYYDIDFAHPNYLATQVVYEYFENLCIDKSEKDLISQIYEITIASQHKARFPNTMANKDFIEKNMKKIRTLEEEYSFLDFEKEKSLFQKKRVED